MVHGLVRQSLNVLLQPVCLSCGTRLSRDRHTLLCDKCFKRLKACCFPDPRIEPIAPGTMLYALSAYQEPLISLWHNVKYRPVPLAMGLLQSLFSRPFQLVLEQLRPHKIIPVPLHWWKRYVVRGYDHTRTLLSGLCTPRQALRVHPCVRRARYTKALYPFSRQDRARILRNAFRLPAAGLRDQHILLFDDIYTTGATISELLALLQKDHPRKISVLVISRAFHSNV